jgi:hypothetical protein
VNLLGLALAMTGQDALMGMRLMIDPSLDNVPRMQLSAALSSNLPPAFVEDYNAWLREFFGTESQVIATPHMMALGPRSYAKIKGIVNG